MRGKPTLDDFESLADDIDCLARDYSLAAVVGALRAVISLRIEAIDSTWAGMTADDATEAYGAAASDLVDVRKALARATQLEKRLRDAEAEAAMAETIARRAQEEPDDEPMRDAQGGPVLAPCGCRRRTDGIVDHMPPCEEVSANYNSRLGD